MVVNTSGTADPAFNANVLPIRYWSLAWWETWRPHSTMVTSLRAAAARVINGDCWRKVTGPATTVIACMHRLGWAM
eukprot:3436301-Lingulodinium_polyedra.AAC.1